MRALLFVFTVVLYSCSHLAAAQDCPKENPNGPSVDSAPRTLTGKVVFHNNLRKWLSLKLDQPICGERTVELFMLDAKGEWTPALQAFRGCRVSTTGILGLPGTGYYSANIYQTVDKVEPRADCVRQPLIPDYSKARPEQDVRSYQVRMWFNYGFEAPVYASITSADRSLRPWQAYASYFLTGGFVFYAYCADSFSMSHFHATPAARPMRIDNYAAIDPETAATRHVRRIQLFYTCRR